MSLPMTETSGFAEALIALGVHMRHNPDLPSVGSVKWMYDRGTEGYIEGLDVQLYGRTSQVLSAWAPTLVDVSSEARRQRNGKVFGFVFGLLGGVPVCVWASGLDSDAFGAAPGVHEWDVTVQSQEA